METIRFITESNAIEGILRLPTDEEIDATDVFLNLRAPYVSDLCKLVNVYEPDAVIRDEPGMDVQVGSHRPPKGGLRILYSLENLLLDIPVLLPFTLHKRYENLHPFTDGNGRSGRTLWLWQMMNQNNQIYNSFLQTWYYQSLER